MAECIFDENGSRTCSEFENKEHEVDPDKLEEYGIWIGQVLSNFALSIVTDLYGTYTVLLN